MTVYTYSGGSGVADVTSPSVLFLSDSVTDGAVVVVLVDIDAVVVEVVVDDDGVVVVVVTDDDVVKAGGDAVGADGDEVGAVGDVVAAVDVVGRVVIKSIRRCLYAGNLVYVLTGNK